MTTIEIQLIKKGVRSYIFAIRNVCMVLFGTALLISLISELMLLLIISISALILTITLTILLLFEQKVGTLIIKGDNIVLVRNEKEITLNQLRIELNADTFELEQAKKDVKHIKDILKIGNRIHSDELPDQQREWELILTEENRRKLFQVRNNCITLTPQFDSRPLLMNSPKAIFDTIAGIGSMWS